MRRTTISCLFAILFACTLTARADDPTFKITAEYKYMVDGEEVIGDENTEEIRSGVSAPLYAVYRSNPTDTIGWEVRYEWTITRQESSSSPIVHRFDEINEYTFTMSGTYDVRLVVTARDKSGQRPDVYYDSAEDIGRMTVSIQKSKLEFPNTFTPNGDGSNDTFHAKKGYQSIVKFKATIFNRMGQRLYEWDSPMGEWDGRYHGNIVKDGTYFLVVEARGADDEEYKIRKTINVITKANRNEGEE